MKIKALHTESSPNKGMPLCLLSVQSECMKQNLKPWKKLENRVKIQSCFYQGFREKLKIIGRFMKDHAILERNNKKKLELKQKIRLKSQKIERKPLVIGKVKAEKMVNSSVQSPEGLGEICAAYEPRISSCREKELCYNVKHSKIPVSLSAIKLDPFIIPERKKRTASTDELKAFFCHRKKSSNRFN